VQRDRLQQMERETVRDLEREKTPWRRLICALKTIRCSPCGGGRLLAAASACVDAGQTDLIKTVALLLMVADHISMLCGLDNDWLRLAGRERFRSLAWSGP
jgi:hypothetical protein